jgi:hypothetical protein
MDVKTGGEGRQKRVTRKSMMALKEVMMGPSARQPGPGEAVRV